MSPKRTTAKTMIDAKIRESHLQIGFICQSLGVDPKQMLNYRTGKTAPPYELLVRLANLLTERGVPCSADDLKEREYRAPGRPKTSKLSEFTYTFEDAGPLVEATALYYIAAGPLTDEAIEPEEELVLVPEALAGYWLLRARGDSMTGWKIRDGDLLVVDKDRSAKSGDVVIAKIGHGWTCGILRVKGSRRWLEKAGPGHKDIPITKAGVTIEGVVIKKLTVETPARS